MDSPNVYWVGDTLPHTLSRYIYNNVHILTGRFVVSHTTPVYIDGAICCRLCDPNIYWPCNMSSSTRPQYTLMGQDVCILMLQYISGGQCLCSSTTPTYIGRAIRVQCPGFDTYSVGNMLPYSNMIDKYILQTYCTHYPGCEAFLTGSYLGENSPKSGDSSRDEFCRRCRREKQTVFRNKQSSSETGVIKTHAIEHTVATSTVGTNIK